jgi:hypothetical protein
MVPSTAMVTTAAGASKSLRRQDAHGQGEQSKQS